MNRIKPVNIFSIPEKEKEYIKNLSLYIQNCSSKYQQNKPHRNVIMLSMPGFQESNFFCNLKTLDNIQIIELENNHNYKKLPELFYKYRKYILTKHDNNKVFDEDLIVALSMHLTSLFQMNRYDFIKTVVNVFGYRLIGLIRDPISTIIFWNNNSLDLPEANIEENKLHPTWKYLNFNTSNLYERQAIIWEYYARLLWDLKSIIKLYYYEQFIKFPNKIIQSICDYLILPYPEITYKPTQNTLPNCNDRCNNLNSIVSAVKKYCPTRLNFGYNDSGEIKTEVWSDKPMIFCRSVPNIA